jgi:hypothetical protein
LQQIHEGSPTYSPFTMFYFSHMESMAGTGISHYEGEIMLHRSRVRVRIKRSRSRSLILMLRMVIRKGMVHQRRRTSLRHTSMHIIFPHGKMKPL